MLKAETRNRFRLHPQLERHQKALLEALFVSAPPELTHASSLSAFSAHLTAAHEFLLAVNVFRTANALSALQQSESRARGTLFDEQRTAWGTLLGFAPARRTLPEDPPVVPLDSARLQAESAAQAALATLQSLSGSAGVASKRAVLDRALSHLERERVALSAEKRALASATRALVGDLACTKQLARQLIDCIHTELTAVATSEVVTATARMDSAKRVGIVLRALASPTSALHDMDLDGAVGSDAAAEPGRLVDPAFVENLLSGPSAGASLPALVASSSVNSPLLLGSPPPDPSSPARAQGTQEAQTAEPILFPDRQNGRPLAVHPAGSGGFEDLLPESVNVLQNHSSVRDVVLPSLQQLAPGPTPAPPPSATLHTYNPPSALPLGPSPPPEDQVSLSAGAATAVTADQIRQRLDALCELRAQMAARIASQQK